MMNKTIGNCLWLVCLSLFLELCWGCLHVGVVPATSEGLTEDMLSKLKGTYHWQNIESKYSCTNTLTTTIRLRNKPYYHNHILHGFLKYTMKNTALFYIVLTVIFFNFFSFHLCTIFRSDLKLLWLNEYNNLICL